jgi:hypothetical protein
MNICDRMYMTFLDDYFKKYRHHGRELSRKTIATYIGLVRSRISSRRKFTEEEIKTAREDKKNHNQKASAYTHFNAALLEDVNLQQENVKLRATTESTITSAIIEATTEATKVTSTTEVTEATEAVAKEAINRVAQQPVASENAFSEAAVTRTRADTAEHDLYHERMGRVAAEHARDRAEARMYRQDIITYHRGQPGYPYDLYKSGDFDIRVPKTDSREDDRPKQTLYMFMYPITSDVIGHVIRPINEISYDHGYVKYRYADGAVLQIARHHVQYFERQSLKVIFTDVVDNDQSTVNTVSDDI